MDVITLGESMVLFTPESSGPLRYVERLHRTIGGAESNVAIALSRLGHKVGWISKLGKDEFGLYIRNTIRGEGVDTSQVVFDKHFPTGIFFKERKIHGDPNIYYYRQHSAASSMDPKSIDFSYVKKAKYIHLTGITPALSTSCKKTIYKVLEEVKANQHQKIVFDPNIRLKLWSEADAREVLTDIAQKCDIVLPGIDEGRLMTGETTPENISHYFLERGTKAVIVKLGENGAYYTTDKESMYVPGEKVESLVDTVGAGDGFAAGVISGLLRGWGYHQSVQLGNKMGACALGVEGDIEGYPYWEEIDPNSPANHINR
ncbi:sugar kinase [Evansella halocellulosilytica]|uniref:sugar kinase n=1 Tax=Evansella halocellulosilytica TaxID=2011013 RepID=UPI000BB98929|nr:sugar kinase [Evansella halocellulosilytica]